MFARFVRPLGLLTLAGLVLGCGSSSTKGGTLQPSGRLPNAAPPSDPAANPTAPPATIPIKQINQTVLDRYREYQQVYKKVYEINDPTSLATVAIDPLLTFVTKDVQATAAKGEIWRFTNALNPRVHGRTTDGATVFVIDCVRTLSAYRYSARTNKRTGGGTGDAFAVRTTLRYDAGTWKVSESKRGKQC